MRKEVRRVTRKLNQEGLRALAVGYKWLPPEDRTYTVEDEKDFVLAGYVAFLDPPKDTARQAIAALREHGVAVKIITGDNEVVTRKICKEVGLPIEHALLGKDVEKLSDVQLEEAAEPTTIFAKMSPVQKTRVIRACKGTVIQSAISATALMTLPRSKMRTWEFRWIPPSISPRNRQTSFCWKKAC